MSTASSAKRSSISARIASVQGSAPKMPTSQRAGARVEALARELVADRQHVGRRHHDDVGLEVLDQLDLALGHAARHRHHGAAEPLGAVVRAEAAGEQAVAVDHVHDVARAARRRRGSSARRPRPRSRCRPWCSRPPWACRWCPTRRGSAPPARAARRTCRTDSAGAGRPWSVNGNFARSASSRRSSGWTPARSNAAR